jgi:hypothetical protein
MDHNSLFTSFEATQSWLEKVQVQTLELAPVPAGASSQTYNQNPGRKKYRTSCTCCRQKKVKCDRAEPCSRCVRVGAICVSLPPSGVPRGRKGGRRKRDRTILDRILKIESLVNDIEGRTNGKTTAMPLPVNENRPVRHLNSRSC